jgi:ribosomal protein S18 acetylase RimI-like enzyme
VSGILRIRKTIREGGIPLLLFRICHKFASPVLDFGSTIFFALDFGNAEVRPFRPRRKAQFMCGQAYLADAGGLLDASDPIRSLEQIETRFREGQICFAARNSEGRIVHTRWGAPNAVNIAELNLDIQPSPGEIYVYDSYTHPEFRGLGVASQLQSFIVEALPAMGYSRLLAFVKGDNIPVLRSIKPPHRKTGRLFYFRFFGFNPIIFGLGSSELPQLVIPETAHRAAEALQYGRSGK